MPQNRKPLGVDRGWRLGACVRVLVCALRNEKVIAQFRCGVLRGWGVGVGGGAMRKLIEGPSHTKSAVAFYVPGNRLAVMCPWVDFSLVG